MRTSARFPNVSAASGHYESFYVKASHPSGGKAIWLRHTTFQRPGESAAASLWLTLFDADLRGPVASKQTFGADQISVPGGGYIQIAESALTPGRASGSIAGESPAAMWRLKFEGDADAFHHLPHSRMYRSRLPKTKLLSPHPMVRFNGTVSIDNTTFELDAWPGMIGHNWGAEHAEEWIWLHAADLGGEAGDHFDVGIGRVKVGPVTTPWIANGRIVLGGEEHRLGGIGQAYGTEIDADAHGCEFTLPGKKINVKGRVSAPAKDFVAWAYADPSGPDHTAINCSISDIELRVERPDEKHVKIEMAGIAAYELGTRDAGISVPLQPFTDG